MPDIQMIGKGLGAGYQPVAAVLFSEKVVKVINEGTGQLIHGLTYQGMPIQSSVAIEVLRIIKEDELLKNVTVQGEYLHKRLTEKIGNHPNVGDIRGRGLFRGIEFVEDKITKKPFDSQLSIAFKFQKFVLSDPYNITVYPGTGCVDGVT